MLCSTTVTALIWAALAFAPVSSTSTFGKNFVPKNMVVMGDSYSDSCNVLRQNNQTIAEQYPFPSCPSSPLGRANQGPEWPEWLRIAQGQKETKGGSPGGDPRKGSHNQTNIANLAQSGATCNNYYFPRAPVNDVGQQIKLLQNGYNGTVDSVQPPVDGDTDVALIWIGTNDVSFFVSNISGAPANLATGDPYKLGTIVDYVDCVFGRLHQLYELGYRKMVLLELIPLELTPYYNPNASISSNGLTEEGLPTAIQQITLAINMIFPARASQFEAKYAGSNVEIFPTHELFSRFYFHNDDYGFSRLTTSTYGAGSSNIDTPTVPREDLWANDLHFSPAAARILGRKIGRFLAGDRGEALLRGQS